MGDEDDTVDAMFPLEGVCHLVPKRRPPMASSTSASPPSQPQVAQSFASHRISPGASPEERQVMLLWAHFASYLPDDIDSLQKYFVNHIEHTLALSRSQLAPRSALQALSYCIRDRLIERWKDTDSFFKQEDVKHVAYLSLEYLMGRSLQNALDFMGQYLFMEQEMDAGLGNGGLGRLASCFMDSLATMNYPAWGYGLRYTYGMFAQKFDDQGNQVESPDYWLNFGNPWEIQRLDLTYSIPFYGTVTALPSPPNSPPKCTWTTTEGSVAVAYDIPIPGFNTFNTINMRLWSSKPSTQFDLESFNRGDYFKAVEKRQLAENITNVLYPNDNTMCGKELRLKQQYFFVAATLKDIISRFTATNKPYAQFHNFVAIQLNDTHPSIGIAELMRILVDEKDVAWTDAWNITIKTFAYTNHTVLPEALEKWPVTMLETLLPRHLRLIYDINHIFLTETKQIFPLDFDLIRNVSIIEEGPNKSIRMANLAIVGSHCVNGVAQIHSELLRTIVFRDFFKIWPHKFHNITNGVTPRRWLHQANPDLSRFITELMGGSQEWIRKLSMIKTIAQHADNPEVQQRWLMVKQYNKRRLAAYVARHFNIILDINALFDIHAKRFHEYKRQLMNCYHIIYRWNKIRGMTPTQRLSVVPRVVIIGGKAAPGYSIAKLIIKLMNQVARVVNSDPEVGDLMKVVFLPNYCVSLAEMMIPASDISQHISTAGMEASGTSNMKFCCNGGLILGTLDGANIEIMDEIGSSNMFIFGAKAQEVSNLRRNPPPVDPRLQTVFDIIQAGAFGDPRQYVELINRSHGTGDFYITCADFPSYLEAHATIDRTYQDKPQWARMSIITTACMGRFSSDRSIRQYAEQIWNLQECARPDPSPPVPLKLAPAPVQAHTAPTLPQPISTGTHSKW
ncbi:glycogen phosphorylase 2 [Pelomyxa schiedti]|nr:glycogen phosphorylase 2 [Pelomyxa schiedti]